MSWMLVDEDGNTREFESRAAAESEKKELEDIGANLTLAKQGDTTDEETVVTVAEKHDVEEPEELDEAVQTANEIGRTNRQNVDSENVPSNGDIPEKRPNVSEDPISWMPEHFVDMIDGVPAINRKGYAVLAEHYNISVKAEPVTIPSETGFEYAEFTAVARTPDGEEYSGFGSAHVDRGDDKTLLGELAETRALKRSIAWATGIGMTAVSELQGTLDGDQQ